MSTWRRYLGGFAIVVSLLCGASMAVASGSGVSADAGNATQASNEAPAASQVSETIVPNSGLRELSKLPSAPIRIAAPASPRLFGVPASLGSLLPRDTKQGARTPSVSKASRGSKSTRAAVRRARRRQRAHDRWLRSSRARAERRRSRTRYTHLGSGTAIAAIQQAAPQVAVTPAWQPPALKPDERIKAYTGPHTAVLDIPGSKTDAIIESSAPMIAKTEDGVMAPVDTTLVDAASGGWKAVNVPARTTIGRTIGDGISVGDDGDRVVVTPGGRTGTVGRIDSGKAIFPNSDVDTDTIVEPTPTGVSVAWTLRSPAAAESQTMHVSLPAGVTLRAQGPSLVLMRGTETVGAVSAPVATDAQGTSVPASYALVGPNDIEVRVPHRKRDIAYPVAIDPYLDWYYSDITLFDNDNNWVFEINDWRAAGWSQAWNGGSPPRWNELWGDPDINPNQNGHQNSTYGAWLRQTAPNASYIFRADFWSLVHDASGTNLRVGLFDSGGWVAGWYDHLASSGNLSSTSITVCATAGCPAWAGSAGNTAGMQLWRVSGTTTWARAGFNQSYLYLRDREDPSVGMPSYYPTTWQNARDNFPGTITATDAGLGLTQIFAGGWQAWSSGCTGGTASPCPTSATPSYLVHSLNDGENPIQFSAQDVLGRWGAQTVKFFYDGHAPTIRLADALWSRRGRTLSAKTPLRVKATDPLGGGQGSGIASMKIQYAVDSGTPSWADLHSFASHSCPTSYCSSVDDESWTFDPDDSAHFTPGTKYLIRAVATDAAGNTGVSDVIDVTISTGSITTLDEGIYTARRAKLQAVVKPSVTSGLTGVTFKYRIPSPSCAGPNDCWQSIPTADVTQGRDQAVSSWPLSLTEQRSPTVTWDVAKTTADSGGAFQDGKVQVRGEFTGGSSPGTTQDIVFNVDRSGIKTTDSTESVGPGSVDLISGNFALSATDVSISSPIADLSVARTYNSRSADDGPLGPKWQLSFPVPQANGADFVALDDATGEADEDGYAFESVTVTRGDASKMVFEGYRTASESTTYFASTDGDTEYELSRTGDTFKLIDEDGNTTTFAADGSSLTHFLPRSVDQPGGATAIGYGRDPAHQNRVAWVFGPHPSDTKCSYEWVATSQLEPECRALHLDYDSNGHLSTVALSTAAPDGSGGYTRSESTVAQYEYENDGSGHYHLKDVYDPRISPNLKTAFAYNNYADNLLTTVTPPGEEPWTLSYIAATSGAGDVNATGRLRYASRPTLDSGGNPSTPAQTTVAYDIPRSGGSAPYAMGQATTATWGQGDLPATATAIFPPSQVPADPPVSYSKATIDYVDAFGYTVNEASPGGAITTNEHDHFGNVVRSLSARNRERALAATDTDATSRQLDTQSTYTADGKDLVDELGPLHSVKRTSDGATVDGRRHTTIAYDEGKPASPADTNYHLPTTTSVGLLTPSAFPATGVIDDANRSDSSSLGTGWTTPSFSPAMRIASNQFAAPTSGADAWAFRSSATSGADSEAFAKLATISSSNTAELYVRTGSTSGNGYSVLAYNGQVELNRSDGFARTTLKTISQPVASGDSLGARIIGDVLTAYYKPSGGSWIALGSATDSTYTAAGQIGFHLNSTTARADDFGGGSVSSGGDSDKRTTTTGYDLLSGDTLPTGCSDVHCGLAPSGWALRKPTSVTVDPGSGHLELTSRTHYNDRGQATLVSRPADASGATAGSTKYVYWNQPSAPTACTGHREWAGMLCQKAPAAASPALPTSTYTYNKLGDVLTTTDAVAGGPARTSTTTYDDAGRKLTDSVDGLDRTIGGMVGWWKADAITGKHDGDAVSSWQDLSGNGRTLSQGTSGEQPKYSLSAIGAGRFAATGVIDDANRADSLLLGSGWSSPGWAETPQIIDHEIAAPSSASGTWSWRDDSVGPDSEVFTRLPVVSEDMNVDLYVRFDDGSANGYAISAFDDHVTLQRVDGFDYTVLATFNRELSDGDSLGARMVGDTLTAYYKPSGGAWTELGSAVDDTYAGQGKIGFHIDHTDMRLDDFGGGTISNDFASTGVVDDADRSDASSLGSGWTSPGWAETARIVDHEIAAPSDGSGTWSWRDEEFGADSEVFTRMPVVSGDMGIDLYLRFDDSEANGYAVSAYDGHVKLQRVDGFDYTELQAFDQELSDGDSLGARMVGNKLIAYYKHDDGDWTEIGSVTDDTYTAAGKIGFHIDHTDMRLDDFGGGTYVPGLGSEVPVVRHDGVDDYLQMSSGVTTAKTVFVVGSWEGPHEDNRPLLGDSTYDDFHGGASDGTGLGADHLWYSTSVNSRIYGGGASGTRINGKDVSFSAAIKPADGRLELMEATTNGTEALRFNRTTGDRSYADRVWSGDYAEIVAYDHVLTSTERANVEGYLLEKYGIAGDVHATDVGASLPTTSYSYDADTGRLLKTSAAGKDITRTYDSLGRLTDYTDADGATSTTSYDSRGRVDTFDDGKGTQTFTYDDRDLPTQIVDSQLGTISGSYDADGQLTSETLPGGLKLLQTYDETGDPVRRCYTRQTSCGTSSPWVDMTALSNVHGQVIDESTSGIGVRHYSYDDASRLAQSQDIATGADCVSRRYSYDANSNRKGVAALTGSGSSCSTPSPNTTQHSYLADDRLDDAHVVYDRFGRTLELPDADAGGTGHALSATYYANDLARTITQEGKVTTLLLDPSNRPRLRLSTGAVNETQHYSDDTDSPSYAQKNQDYQRSVTGLDGNLAGLHDSNDGDKLTLTDMHGDTIAETDTGSGTTAPAAKRDQDEFGVPIGDQHEGRFQWLGAKQRQTQTAQGVITMGARLYVPQLGRFLQVDPVDGGSANPYDYANQDPVNQFDLAGLAPKDWKGGREPAAKRTTRAITVYRYYGGSSARRGSWVSRADYNTPATARARLALPPGNTAKWVTAVRIPPGALIREGVASKQLGMPGGGPQIELLERLPRTAFGTGVRVSPGWHLGTVGGGAPRRGSTQDERL